MFVLHRLHLKVRITGNPLRNFFRCRKTSVRSVPWFYRIIFTVRTVSSWNFSHLRRIAALPVTVSYFSFEPCCDRTRAFVPCVMSSGCARNMGWSKKPAPVSRLSTPRVFSIGPEWFLIKLFTVHEMIMALFCLRQFPSPYCRASALWQRNAVNLTVPARCRIWNITWDKRSTNYRGRSVFFLKCLQCTSRSVIKQPYNMATLFYAHFNAPRVFRKFWMQRDFRWSYEGWSWCRVFFST